MTTRKAKGEKPATSPAAETPRVRRPMPARTAPIRSGIAAAAATAAAAARTPPAPAEDVPISESVASAVRLGYDVVAENIKQGRVAAERFRHGEYNIRDVPEDVEALAKRMLDLARDLTTTTFDVVERLLKESKAGSRAASPPRAPPFRATPASPVPRRPAAAGAAPSAGSAAASAATPGPEMPVTCNFVGKRKAIVRSALLSRPVKPIIPDLQLSIEALQASEGSAVIGGVKFAADGTALRITIPIADDLPAGSYSGLVCAEGSPWALGVLAIEVLP